MPDIIEWPGNLAISDRTDPQLVFNTRSGGVAMDGSEQILSALSSAWKWRIVVPVVRGDQAMAIRVVKSKLKGRFNYLRINVCDQYRISRKNIGAWNPDGDVPHFDGARFSDSTGYSLAQPRSNVTSDAGAGSETLIIDSAPLGDYMTAGVFFSLSDWLYQIDGWTYDGSHYALSISPPLRQNAVAGQEVDFNSRSIWRVDSDDYAPLDLQGGRFGAVELNLVEPVNRDAT